MSHVVEVKTEIRDVEAVKATCQRLKLPEPVHGTTKLFSGEATGLAVQLPDWRYPVVCEMQTGNLRYDNYGGHWGDQKQLDRFLQIYAVEVTKVQAHKKGHTLAEQELVDGSIKLTIQVNGGAA